MKVKIHPAKYIIIDGDYGKGFKAGSCIACGSGGVLHGQYGYPYPGNGCKFPGSDLIHKKLCPVTAWLIKNPKQQPKDTK